MSKLLKKSLACCLAIALCLTMAVGAITASADTNTIVVDTVSVANNAESVDLPITITTTGINVATLTIKLPASEDATINTITNIAAEGAVATWKTGDNTVSDSTAEEFVAPVVSGDKITLMVNAIDSTGVFTEAVITITYSLADVAVGTYEVAVVDSEAYDNNREDANLVALTATAGSITVTMAEHECVPGEVVIENEVAADCDTAGSYDEVTYCTVCNEELSRETKTVEALGHAWGEGVIDPDATCTEEGVITYTCGTCGETKTEAVSAKGHTPADAVEENRVEAQPGVAGSYDMVVYCSVCTAELSRTPYEIPALPVEPTCEHANTTVVSATPAVDGGAKGSIVLHCDDCDVDLPAKEVSYYMYYQFSQNTLSSESEVVINFKALDMALNFQGGYDDIFVKVGLAGEEGYKGSDAMAETLINSNSAKQWSFGLKAYEYTCDVNCTIFAYHDGAWYSGPTKTTSVAATANVLLADSKVKDSEKNMLANLLDYGEKAQLNFGRYTEKLATADMAAADKARIVTTTAEYADTHINNFNANTEKAIVAQCSVAAESKVTFRYTTAIAKTVDINAVTAKISFVNAEGETITTTIDSSKFSYYAANNTHTMYVIEFSNFAAYDLRRDFTLNVYDGETLISCDVIYSVESLVAILNAGTIKDTEKAMYNSLLHYGDLADTHFKG